MSISPNKKDFICYIAGGLSTLMNSSMISDEIYTSQDDDIEVYIKDISSKVNIPRRQLLWSHGDIDDKPS